MTTKSYCDTTAFERQLIARRQFSQLAQMWGCTEEAARLCISGGKKVVPMVVLPPKPKAADPVKKARRESYIGRHCPAPETVIMTIRRRMKTLDIRYCDLAKMIGLTPGGVSCALATSGHMSPRTLEKIYAALESKETSLRVTS